LAIFAFQLVLNVAWSGLFFGLRSPGLASLEIIALLAAILATTWVFWRISTVAGSMMIPYLVWAAFAAVLNWAIWFLNASNH
jgi:translocator protein